MSIDADLQDPPELTSGLIDKWHEGYNVVSARRISRRGETGSRRLRPPQSIGSCTGSVARWNYWNLWSFSLEGITSFTTAPLRISTCLGLVTASTAFIYGLYIFGKALFIGDQVPGFPSLMKMLAFLGGVQLTVLGIIGEYLGHIFNETKKSSDLYCYFSVKRQRLSFILPP